MTQIIDEAIIGVNKVIKITVADCSDKPSPRSGHRIVADDSYMWVVGGYNPDRPNHPLYKEIWQLNLTTLKWKAITCQGDMPVELASHSAARVGQYVVVFGGTDYPFGHDSSNKVSVCDLQSNLWRCLECTGQFPDEKYGQAMLVHGNNLYVHGGTTGFFYNSDLHKLNLRTLEWTLVVANNESSEIPKERYRHELAAYRDNLFILGGGTSHVVLTLRKLSIFDLKLERWMYRSTKRDSSHNPGYPRARRCHGCIQLDDEAYISGGYDGTDIMDDIWKINLQTLQWTKIATMPEPVYFHSAAVSPAGCMLIFGGVNAIEHNQRTANCYRIWLRVPSLQIMCWQRLTTAYPQLLKAPEEQLKRIGVCRELIEKLNCPDGA